MNDEQYCAFVGSLKKPGEAIIASMTPEKADIWHMATLLSGETGELVDALKKWIIYGKQIDHANVVEELGDIEFALAGIRSSLGLSRDLVVGANVDKLSRRYASGGYSDEEAIIRADKQCSIDATV